MTWRFATRAVATALAASGLFGCGGGESSGGGDVSVRVDCEDTVVWHDTTYVSYGTLRVDRAASLGRARVPACQAPGQDGGRRARNVHVHRLAGVPPALAVGVGGQRSPYLAEGFLLPLKSHPLHDRVYGSARQPRRPSARCRQRFSWNAVVQRAPAISHGIFVRPERERDAYVKLHADTRVTGFARSGHPFLRPGDLIRAAGVICPAGTFVANAVAPSR